MEVVVSLGLVQIYEFNDAEDGQTYLWNATLGRTIAEDGRDFIPIHLADLGMTAAKILTMAPDLDKKKALKLPGAALLSPLLFVQHREKHVLIDGWHRLYKAAVQGFPVLPAYILDHAEAERIRVK